MPKIDSWFPTLVYSHDLSSSEETNLYLKNKALSLQEKYASNNKNEWRCDTFNTLNQYVGYNKDSVEKKLIMSIKNHILHFSKTYLNIKRDDLECTDFWYNVASTGAYQEYHIHPNNHFSVVYYVQTPINCGRIVLTDPSASGILDMQPLPIVEYNRNTFPTCYYEPTESLLLIFRSNVPHMVEKNKSNENRISISMNFKFKG
jgi:uncharacterized protein (TIGR02466 family)